MISVSRIMTAKYVVAISLFLLATFGSYAQDSISKRCMLWDEPYDYSFGLTYGWSNASNSIKGIEWRCRWFGVDLEFDKGFYEIGSQKYYLKESQMMVNFDGDDRNGTITNDRLGAIGYCMIVPSAHFRYFSFGLGVGLSIYSWLFIGVPESGIGGKEIGRLWPRLRVKPVLSGHIPLFCNSMVLSFKMGYDMEIQQLDGLPCKVKDGFAFNLGLSKAF